LGRDKRQGKSDGLAAGKKDVRSDRIKNSSHQKEGLAKRKRKHQGGGGINNQKLGSGRNVGEAGDRPT